MFYIIILNGVHNDCTWWLFVGIIVVFLYLGVQSTLYYINQNRWTEAVFESEIALFNFQRFIASNYARERVIEFNEGKSTTYILNEVYKKGTAVFVLNEKRVTICAALKHIKRFERYLGSKETKTIPVL